MNSVRLCARSRRARDRGGSAGGTEAGDHDLRVGLLEREHAQGRIHAKNHYQRRKTAYRHVMESRSRRYTQLNRVATLSWNRRQLCVEYAVAYPAVRKTLFAKDAS